jgi:hypothetical protein
MRHDQRRDTRVLGWILRGRIVQPDALEQSQRLGVGCVSWQLANER